jgi:hypothetical protein
VAAASALHIRNDRVWRRQEPYVPPTGHYNEGQVGAHGHGLRGTSMPMNSPARRRDPMSVIGSLHHPIGK